MANEKRLIDANELKGKLIRELNKTGKYTPYECGLDDALSYLDKQPTVDVVEVVHGRWIDRTKIIRGIYDYRYDCSVCDHIFWHGGIDSFNYCPNCGADMRERETEDDN